MWESPNGQRIEDGTPSVPEGVPAAWANPDLHLVGHNCGNRTTTATGSTRTCTATWAEITPITLTAKHHGSGRTAPHGGWGHLHLTNSGDGSLHHASTAPHRHCDTETGLAEEGATCPQDTDAQGKPLKEQAPIIAWHPKLQSAGLSFWQRLVLDFAIGFGTGVAGGVAIRTIQIGHKIYKVATVGAVLGAATGLATDSAVRTSDVKVNVMAPNCLPASDHHDSNTWIRQRRSNWSTKDNSMPVPIRTQTEHDGHITRIDHTIDYCVEAEG